MAKSPTAASSKIGAIVVENADNDVSLVPAGQTGQQAKVMEDNHSIANPNNRIIRR